MHKYIIYFDGSCRPINPGGIMGIGFYILSPEKEVIYSFSDWYPENPENSSNKAEALSAYKALEWLFDNTPKEDHDNMIVSLRGDSSVVCKKMGQPNQEFSGYYAEVAEDLYFLSQNSFKKVYFDWIPREQNIQADELSTDTLCRNNFHLCNKNLEN